MEIEMSRSGSITVVGIRGSVDGLTADDLMRTFSDRVTEGSVQLVADCSALDYTSSAGLRSLLGAVKLARQHGGDLRLAAIQTQVLARARSFRLHEHPQVLPGRAKRRDQLRRAGLTRAGGEHEVSDPSQARRGRRHRFGQRQVRGRARARQRAEPRRASRSTCWSDAAPAACTRR